MVSSMLTSCLGIIQEGNWKVFYLWVLSCSVIYIYRPKVGVRKQTKLLTCIIIHMYGGPFSSTPAVVGKPQHQGVSFSPPRRNRQHAQHCSSFYTEKLTPIILNTLSLDTYREGTSRLTAERFVFMSFVSNAEDKLVFSVSYVPRDRGLVWMSCCLRKMFTLSRLFIPNQTVGTWQWHQPLQAQVSVVCQLRRMKCHVVRWVRYFHSVVWSSVLSGIDPHWSLLCRGPKATHRQTPLSSWPHSDVHKMFGTQC